MKLNCVFVFAYAKCWFSHDAALMVISLNSEWLLCNVVYACISVNRFRRGPYRQELLILNLSLARRERRLPE